MCQFNSIQNAVKRGYIASIEMLIQLADTLAVMIPTNRLGEQSTDIKYVQLLHSTPLIFRDRKGIRDDDGFDFIASIQLAQAVAAEEAVGCHAVDFRRSAALDDGFGCSDPGSSAVDHVVYDEDGFVADVPDECDGCFDFGVLECFFLFFVRGCGVSCTAKAVAWGAHARGGC